MDLHNRRPVLQKGNPPVSTVQKIIKNKVGLLNLAEELGNVSRACKVMGYSRDTFYRYKQAVEEGGVEALIEKSRRKPNFRNRTAPEIEEAIVALAIDEPALGQVRVSNELRKRGLYISPAGVRGVWIRNGLQTFKHRLAALVSMDMIFSALRGHHLFRTSRPSGLGGGAARCPG